ncbi:hypothetical protein [Streptomyces sp. CH6]|uniref:hypothetical protein n=1 Tax=unclassified Streptomyces TaxID=2593676 RepID=UPI003CFE7CB6
MNTEQAHSGEGPNPPTRKQSEELTARVLEVFTAWERERIAEGTPAPSDRRPYAEVHELAHDYAQVRDDPMAREDYLDYLSAVLTPADLRALRLAAEAAVAVTPRVIFDQAAQNKDPRKIAEALGLSSARVYDLLRTERANRAALNADKRPR